jgi:hypothetical protein
MTSRTRVGATALGWIPALPPLRASTAGDGALLDGAGRRSSAGLQDIAGSRTASAVYRSKAARSLQGGITTGRSSGVWLGATAARGWAHRWLFSMVAMGEETEKKWGRERTCARKIRLTLSGYV